MSISNATHHNTTITSPIESKEGFDVMNNLFWPFFFPVLMIGFVGLIIFSLIYLYAAKMSKKAGFRGAKTLQVWTMELAQEFWPFIISVGLFGGGLYLLIKEFTTKGFGFLCLFLFIHSSAITFASYIYEVRVSINVARAIKYNANPYRNIPVPASNKT